MISFRTGNEPDHRIAVNPNHIIYVMANGNFTWIYFTNGAKLLVDGELGVVVGRINEWTQTLASWKH
jgi:uncharacterized protein YlzI (FlbEa/FlbD family)